MKRCFTLLFGLWVTIAYSAEGALSSIWVPFGAGRVEVRYSAEMKLKTGVKPEAQSIIQYYHQLLEADYTPFLKDLENKKDSLQLNDWMYYGLMRSSVGAIFSNHPAYEQELIAWFMLSHAGFDTRLAYNRQRAYLYVYVEEEVYELPQIEDNRRTFFYIPYPMQYPIAIEGVYILDFNAMPGGKALSFKWNSYPVIQPRPVKKNLQLRTKDTLYEIAVVIDKALIDFMAQQPILAEQTYFEAPMSPLLSSSLLPQLGVILKARDQREALEILLAFTRSSFAYKDDKAFFGKSKPMVAEELFYYSYSDCEDRAALFYQLVKSLLNLPMVIIAFPDHITIGVGTCWKCDASVTYNGRDYCICDPTGPVNSWETGRWPKGYENRTYEIIGAWP